MFRTLVRAGWNRSQSFCVGVIVCTAPAFQVYASWATIAVGPFAAAASALAFFLADRAFEAHPFRRKILLAAGAALTQFSAFAIYQPAAMFFWVPAAIVLLQPKPPPHLLKRFGWYGMILLIGMLAGFAAVKLAAILYPHEYSQKSALVRDLSAKAMWFLDKPLPQALTFFWVFPNRFLKVWDVDSSWKLVDGVVASGIFVFIASGLMAYFRREPEYAGRRWAIAVVLLPMTYLPNLAVAQSWASYRTLSSLSSLLVVYAYFACHGHARLLSRLRSRARGNAAMAAAAAACALSAAYHVNTFFVTPRPGVGVPAFAIGTEGGAPFANVERQDNPFPLSGYACAVRKL